MAVYCVSEWVELDDIHADVAEAHGQLRIDAVREEIGRSLAEGQRLIADPKCRAEQWVELSTGLQRECLRFATAIYCVNEWVEPTDTRADVDEAHRQLRKLNLAGTSL